MAVSNRVPVLSRILRMIREGAGMTHGLPCLTAFFRYRWDRVSPVAALLFLLPLMQGCGLLFDAVQQIYPVTTNELDRICRRQQVQVGMAVEPFRPFVFPAVWTDEGARVTGLDTELVRAVSDALTIHCGAPVVPALHLVRFRDLFLLLNEGQLDFFVSAVAAGTPSPSRAGFAYSTPYFSQGGIGAIATRPGVIEQIQRRLKTDEGGTARERLLEGLTIAVQDNTSAHLYAEANIKTANVLVCDSLPAAFEHATAGLSPPIDVILGAHPVLKFMAKTTRRDWQLLAKDEHTPLWFTLADYAVVMAEESYTLRWFINDVIFQLHESGRLEQMRRRWIDDAYAYPRRASAEGLPFDVQKMPAHYAQGTCRTASPH
ncbi:MAG: transporter substrate-binding domain-containing protein [Nitrospira sp. CG24D]|nr:MAG: transporter substrate-binding domain-containing protein [Nitrospira sp. CG24D]